MDVLRGLAILAVVLFHSASLLRLAGLTAPAELRAFNSALAPFRIPMLVLLSGLLLPKSIRKGTGRYLGGKARAILWPYLLWSGVIGALMWNQYGLGSIRWLVPSVLIGGTYLWYLLFLLGFYVAALALQRVPRLLVVVVSLAGSELLPDGTKYMERPTFLFALFVLGWWLAEHRRGLDAAFASRFLPVLAVVVLVASYLVTDMGGYGPRAAAGTLAGVFLLAVAAWRLDRLRVLRPLRFVGRNSIVYYVVHFPVITVVMTIGGALGLDLVWPLVAASAFSALLVGTLLARGRVRSSFVEGLFSAPSWILLGVSRLSPLRERRVSAVGVGVRSSRSG